MFLVATAVGVEFGIANKVGLTQDSCKYRIFSILDDDIVWRGFSSLLAYTYRRNGGHHSAVIADTKGNALGPRKKIDQSVRERLSPYFYFI
jgi:hypothetical protein